MAAMGSVTGTLHFLLHLDPLLGPGTPATKSQAIPGSQHLRSHSTTLARCSRPPAWPPWTRLTQDTVCAVPC